jgi:hypothetical protein
MAIDIPASTPRLIVEFVVGTLPTTAFDAVRIATVLGMLPNTAFASEHGKRQQHQWLSREKLRHFRCFAAVSVVGETATFSLFCRSLPARRTVLSGTGIARWSFGNTSNINGCRGRKVGIFVVLPTFIGAAHGPFRHACAMRRQERRRHAAPRPRKYATRRQLFTRWRQALCRRRR